MIKVHENLSLQFRRSYCSDLTTPIYIAVNLLNYQQMVKMDYIVLFFFNLLLSPLSFLGNPCIVNFGQCILKGLLII